MPTIIFVVGPTATGKTDVAFGLACSLGAQIISADSMAIYKEPRVITSKPSEAMRARIPHHLVDIISVQENYSVFDYYHQALEIIKAAKGKAPLIVCGGSGLYIKAILDGIFEGAGKDERVRSDLEKQAREHGREYLYEELKKVDPQTAGKVSANDVKRIVRALEVFMVTGVALSQKKQEAKGLWGDVPIKIFGLRLARETLYERINRRTEEMFAAGAIGEVERLLQHPLSLTASKIIGIKEIAGFLNGEYTREKAKELMQQNTRRFAKRQMTWFRADKRICWLDIEALTTEATVQHIIREMKA
ncbi:MAG: tRNA (adenosine(37)-N6)-dimethylallyltransferase MiaA [Candidatus Omnitrophota bacterium]